jgi:hypothetical protein
MTVTIARPQEAQPLASHYGSIGWHQECWREWAAVGGTTASPVRTVAAILGLRLDVVESALQNTALDEPRLTDAESDEANRTGDARWRVTA